MISVQSHLQQLSGNKGFILLSLFCVTFLMSCGSSKPTSRITRPSNQKPKPTAAIANPDKVDTVAWTVLDSEKYPPITDEENINLNPLIRPIRNISLLAPFEVAGDASTLSRSEKKFGHYYAGVILALEELEEHGKTFSFSTFDTRRNKSDMGRLMQNMDIRQSDVVIGPFESTNLKAVAEWGKENNIPVVSPWRSSSSIAEQNLYYYQIRPLIEQYFEAILKEVQNRHDVSDVFIINEEGKDDDSKVRVLQSIYERLNKGKIIEPLNEYKIYTDSIQDSEHLMFDALLQEHSQIAVIIPNYSSTDARYVYSLIRKINAEIDDQEIAIYGMPTLINADRLDLEFFRSLNLRTVDFKHIDASQELVQTFIKRYFEKYGHLPNDDSYHGYDTMMLLANASEQAMGGNSSEQSNQFQLLSMGLDFKKYTKNKGTSKSARPLFPGDFMVNSSLNLIEYVDNKFVASPIK